MTREEGKAPAGEPRPTGLDDDAIRALLTRLSRPHPSGGRVVERSALLAAGADFSVVMAWITARAGEPEALVEATTGGGLHGTRLNRSGSSTAQTPLRFILPAGALTA